MSYGVLTSVWYDKIHRTWQKRVDDCPSGTQVYSGPVQSSNEADRMIFYKLAHNTRSDHTVCKDIANAIVQYYSQWNVTVPEYEQLMDLLGTPDAWTQAVEYSLELGRVMRDYDKEDVRAAPLLVEKKITSLEVDNPKGYTRVLPRGHAALQVVCLLGEESEKAALKKLYKVARDCLVSQLKDVLRELKKLEKEI